MESSVVFQSMKYILTCLLCISCAQTSAEVYKWVDKKGKVHLSDKRGAPDHAVLINATGKSSRVGNSFRFTPDADTLLQENQRAAYGDTTGLSAGFWNASSVTYEITSLIRFDISALIAEVNTNSNKEVIAAYLELYANTTDKIHPGTNKSSAPTGHYSQRGDNAFYIKAVRSNWDELSLTWKQFYSDDNYTPAIIRTLPSARAEGSSGNDSLDYDIDLTELIQECAKTNTREITLEIRAQRRASTAQVSFYSREAAEDKRPTLRVDLKSTSK